MTFDVKTLNGNWEQVISEITGYTIPKKRKGIPCPIPGCQGKDRFDYTNKYNNGTFICRHCTETGGTGLVFIAKYLGIDTSTAWKLLADKYGGGEALPTRADTSTPEAKFIRTEALADWDKCTLLNKPGKKYRFKNVWDWFDHNGEKFGYVIRMEFIDKKTGELKKRVWQIHHGHFEDSTSVGWHQVSVSPKPLFGYSTHGLNLDYVGIIIVEGEKTCMALKKLMTDFEQKYLILCTQNGSANVKVSDWNPVVTLAETLPVYIWPDNDPTGFKYAAEITSILPMAQTFSEDSLIALGLGNENDDAADLESFTLDDLNQLISFSSTVKSESIEAVAPVPEQTIADFNRLISPLGINDAGNFVFYPKELRCIKTLDSGKLMTGHVLISMVGLDPLVKHFPAFDKDGVPTGGFNAFNAALFLMRQCKNKGVYDPELMRGVGVWKDNKRIVINTGKNLNVDGEFIDYDDMKSDFTYAQPGKLMLPLDEVATTQDINLVLDIIQGFRWTAPYYQFLLLGGLVQACIAPIFRWRSHLWIIGAQGSGKSYIQFNMIRPLLGELCMGVEHGTTAAGIRHKLKHNAFTVSYDEAEVRTGDDPRKMAEVVALARISSSEESTVVKGSASGDAVEYRCQSTFIMSSIKPYLKQESDLARFALLELEPPPEGEEDDTFDEEVVLKCKEIDKEFSQRWVRLCIGLIPKVIENRKQIDEKMKLAGLSPRTRDQYGQLIACASAVLGQEIDFSIFNNVLEETKELTSDAEPIRELNRLLGTEIKIPSEYGGENMTILEAIKILHKLQQPDFIPDSESITRNDKYNSGRIFDLLCSYGIKVAEGNVYIANTSDKIEKILGCPNWGKLFKIIPWVEIGETVISFGTRAYKSRYCSLRIDDLNK